MSSTRAKILLLAGTGEAKKLANALAKRESIDVIASIHGDARLPRDLDVPTRIGGFEDQQELAAFLKDHAISGVIDATHPFAFEISQQANGLCHELDISMCRLERAEWTPRDGDHWICIDDETEAVHHLANCEKVMTFTGRHSIGKFSNIENIYIFNRILHDVSEDFPLPNGEHVFGKPPFSVQGEVDLFRRLEIDAIILRNVGGENGFSKVEAARQLGLKVIMINRPVSSLPKPIRRIEDALEWVDNHFG